MKSANVEGRFQWFDDPGLPRPGPVHGAARRTREHGLAGFIVRMQTVIRTNACPPRTSGWLRLPASPVRPALRSCSPTKRRCSSTGATRYRLATRSMPRRSRSCRAPKHGPSNRSKPISERLNFGYDQWLLPSTAPNASQKPSPMPVRQRSRQNPARSTDCRRSAGAAVGRGHAARFSLCWRIRELQDCPHPS